MEGERLDPYLDWARATQRRYLASGPEEPLRLAGELRSGKTFKGAVAAVQHYGCRLQGQMVLGTRFFTATLSGPIEAAFDALHGHAKFVLAEPGMRSIDPRQPTSARYAEWEGMPRKPEPLRSGVVIGVVDGACGFANAAFSGPDGLSRLDAYWDQGAAPTIDKRWQRPRQVPFGRALSRDSLNGIAQELHPLMGPARVDAETSLYRAIGHTVPDDADWSHGTHVLSTTLAPWSGSDTSERPGVVYVQLPDAALRDTSARWAAAWVLDAIKYITSHAATNAKVIINLSLGAFAGPQDGSSMLERAIDSIVEGSKDRITIVVAAGNAGCILDDGSGLEKQCHARFVLEAADAAEVFDDQKQVTLMWDLDIADSTESFMELWLPELNGDAAGEGVEVTLEHGGTALTTGAVGPGNAGFIRRSGDVVAMVVNRTGRCSVPNGSGGMALVAIGHSSDVASPVAPSGRWTVIVRNRCKTPLTVDARIERRDIPGDMRGYRPQYGLAVEGSGPPSAAGTLGSIANGKRSIVVGALNDKAAPARADYSSEGVGVGVVGCNAREVRRRGPDVYARGKREAAGFFSGSLKDLEGTSMAAAAVSGSIAVAHVSSPKSVAKALDVLKHFLEGPDGIGRPHPPGHPPTRPDVPQRPRARQPEA